MRELVVGFAGLGFIAAVVGLTYALTKMPHWGGGNWWLTTVAVVAVVSLVIGIVDVAGEMVRTHWVDAYRVASDAVVPWALVLALLSMIPKPARRKKGAA